MERTRTGIVAGARAGIVRDGVRRLSMATVAELGGIAKATVYNHVRSKPQLLAMVAHDLLDRVERAAAAPLTLLESLVVAAETAATDDVVRAVAEREPAVLGRLLRMHGSPVWDGAASDDAAVDVVLRWLVSWTVSPADDTRIRQTVSLVLGGLPQPGTGS
jgi:AcrR family transcriptional regulator